MEEWKEMLSESDMDPNFVRPRLEVIQPDPWLAFATLAPLVTEARAYLESGRPEAAMKSLNECRKIIEQMTQPSIIWQAPEKTTETVG